MLEELCSHHFAFSELQREGASQPKSQNWAHADVHLPSERASNLNLLQRIAKEQPPERGTKAALLELLLPPTCWFCLIL